MERYIFLLIILIYLLIVATILLMKAFILSFKEESFEFEIIILLIGLAIAFILPVFIGIIEFLINY